MSNSRVLRWYSVGLFLAGEEAISQFLFETRSVYRGGLRHVVLEP